MAWVVHIFEFLFKFHRGRTQPPTAHHVRDTLPSNPLYASTISNCKSTFPLRIAMDSILPNYLFICSTDGLRSPSMSGACRLGVMHEFWWIPAAIKPSEPATIISHHKVFYPTIKKSHLGIIPTWGFLLGFSASIMPKDDLCSCGEYW